MNFEEFCDLVFENLAEFEQDARFDPLFTDPAGPGRPPVVDEFRAGSEPSARQRRDAIAILRDLGVDPARTSDSDWARISLGIAGTARDRRDVLAAAGYGIGSGLGGVRGRFDFPEFETDRNLGLDPDKIRVLADLYYVHQFDRLGVFRVVDELARRSFDPSFDLGNSDAGLRLYAYIKRKKLRFPEEDRRHLLDRIFEGGEGSGLGTFKPLMGRFVEALIEFARVRNAGELVAGNGSNSTVYTRSAVIRAIVNLQRYMSDAGGGILRYLRDEAGAQLIECFDILEAPEVQRYWGGNFKSGMWAIIEDVIRDLDGRAPPVDRARTLAVHGRRTFSWLADNSGNVEVLTDDEIDVVAEHVQNWISAYRRPDTEPSWLEEDDLYAEDGEDLDPDEVADEAIHEAMNGESNPVDADVLEV